LGYVNGKVAGIESTWQDLRGHADHRKQALQEQLARLQNIENLLLDFAKRGLEFRVWVENADDTLTEPIIVETVPAVQEYQSAFDALLNEKSAKDAEYTSIGDLATQLQSYGVKENTYSEISWASLQTAYNALAGLIENRRGQIATELAKQDANEALRVEFATSANDFSAFLKNQNSAIEGLSGEIQQQLDQIGKTSSDISGGKSHYDTLVQLTHRLDAAGVNDNPHTELTIEGLKQQWDALNTLVFKKQQVLEKELLAQSGTGLSSEAIAEFKECFKHFDKDQDNLLSRLELGACLKSLGEEVGDFKQEGGKLDQILRGMDGDGDGKVTFDEFASYMERVSVGSDTSDSIKQAFKIIANDKDFVTEADLNAVLTKDKVDFILRHIQPYPGIANAFDYNTSTEKTLYG